MLRSLLLCFLFAGLIKAQAATVWTVTGSNQVFTPDSITISYGDTVLFVTEANDRVQEVDANTWQANDSVPVTGFQTAYTGGWVIGLSAGAHYYVSAANVTIGMKGKIVVLPPATVQFSLISDTVAESAGLVPVVVEVNNSSGSPITFTVAADTIHSTAVVDSDYTFRKISFTNNRGLSFDTLYIPVIDDVLIEQTETVLLHMSSITPNGVFAADSDFTLYILDNDTLTMSFLGGAFSYPESTDTAYIGVTISSPVPGITSAIIVLDSGNAVQGVNFTCPDTVTLNFPPNTVDTLYFPVHLINDNVEGGNLQVNFDLINPTNGARLGIIAFTLFIIDDDFTGLTSLNLEKQLQVFPDPVQNNLIIRSEIDEVQTSITDITGNQVLKLGTISAGHRVVDVSALPAGIYLVNFTSNSLQYCRKLVKAN